MSPTRFEPFSRYFGMPEAGCFIYLATEVYNQWRIKELMFYGVETFI